MPSEEGLYSRQPDGAWALNTQLTGSNTQDVQIFTNANVLPGASVLSPEYDLSEYAGIGLVYYNHEANTSAPTIFVQSEVVGTTSAWIFSINGITTLGGASADTRLRGAKVKIGVKNNDAAAHNYSLKKREFKIY